MKLNKYVKSTLAGAAMLAAASKADAAVLSVKTDYSPSAASERTVTDTSPIMTVDSEDKLETDELSLGARLGISNIGGSKIGIVLEDNLIKQSGNLTRNSTVFDIIKIKEEGDYSRSRNTFKIAPAIPLGIKGIGLTIGLNYLTEKEAREYEQSVFGSCNKISTEQSLTAVGPMLRTSYQHQGNINIGFNTDFTSFLSGNEAYKLEFEDKTLPGDPAFERKRDLDSFLSETSVIAAKPVRNEFVNNVGIKAWLDYFSKKIKQKETTETYMPVYEDYKDTRLRYGAELFAKVKKYLTLKLGVKKEQHASKGTFETKDNQMRIYGGAQADIFF